MRMTIDELAARVELPSSTIRMYQQRGLLPRPERRGRVAYYGEGHVQRLGLIADLKERGFSLAGIKELLDARERGDDLDALLRSDAIDEAVRLEPIDPAELVRLVLGDDAEFDPALFARAAELGLVAFDDDGQVRVNRRALALGPAVIALGVPRDVVLDELVALRADTDRVAARFGALFEHYVVPTLAGADPATVTESFNRLVELARDNVDYALLRSLAELRGRVL